MVKKRKVSSKDITDEYGDEADDRMVSDLEALELSGNFENLFKQSAIQKIRKHFGNKKLRIERRFANTWEPQAVVPPGQTFNPDTKYFTDEGEIKWHHTHLKANAVYVWHTMDPAERLYVSAVK